VKDFSVKEDCVRFLPVINHFLINSLLYSPEADTAKKHPAVTLAFPTSSFTTFEHTVYHVVATENTSVKQKISET